MAPAPRRSARVVGTILAGAALAACGVSHGSHASTPSSTSGPAQPRTAPTPSRPVPASVEAAFVALASTPFGFRATRTDRIAGASTSVTLVGGYDPINRDGASTEIGATGTGAAGYGAARVVAGHAWALVAGAWYSVGLGRVPIGQLLVAVRLLESPDAHGMGADGATVEAGPKRLARFATHVPTTLTPAVAGLDRLVVTLVVKGHQPHVLTITATGTVGHHPFASTETVTFTSFGAAVTVHPPASPGVLDIGPPETVLPPL